MSESIVSVSYQRYSGAPKETSPVARLTDHGVVINVGKNSEVLIPWCRVNEVVSHERGVF